MSSISWLPRTAARGPLPASTAAPPWERIALVALLPGLLVLVGTAGYAALERWSLFDALYMSVIVLTTIGFAEVHPLDAGGRVFTMALALGGVFTLFYATTEVLRTLVSSDLQELLGRRRVQRAIDALAGHVIVCGYGRMGRQVCQEFSESRIPFAVIDREPERFGDLSTLGGYSLVGDASEEDVLRRAGIERARALVTVVASDADNVFIAMSARLLNERIAIVARAEEASTVPKLLRAGATRVVSPYAIGGARVAQAVLRPAVLDFIEVATRSEHLELQIEEIFVRPGTRFEGSTIRTTGLRGELGLIVVAVKKPSGHMTFNPPDDAELRDGDTLIVLGGRTQLDAADARAAGARGA